MWVKTAWFKFGEAIKICQTAKLKSPPNKPRIRYKIITDCYIRVCESLELPPVIFKATSSINAGINFGGVPFVYIHTPDTKRSHCFHVKDLATSRIVRWRVFLCCYRKHVCMYYVRLVSFVAAIYQCKMILLDFMMTIIKDWCIYQGLLSGKVTLSMCIVKSFLVIGVVKGFVSIGNHTYLSAIKE